MLCVGEETTGMCVCAALITLTSGLNQIFYILLNQGIDVIMKHDVEAGCFRAISKKPHSFGEPTFSTYTEYF